MDGLLSGLAGFSIRPQDVVDILLTAYILYRGLLLIRGTLAIKMVSALFMLAVIFYAADALQLHLLYWILQNFWTVGLLATVVIFQPELRRALAQIFPGGRWFRSPAGVSVLEEIVSAVTALAAARVGALIVLERDTGLEAIREMGAPIDGLVTSELIRALFHPNSVLHDGAIIVKEGRIARAGCFLPLAKNPYLPATMGTRHRAAIGITEETDAVVVVVSEETGRISVGERGELTAAPDTARLRERLRQALGVRVSG